MPSLRIFQMWRGIASKSLLYDISTNWMYDIKLLLDEPIYLLCMQNIFSLFLVIVMDALPCWVKQLMFSSFTCSIHHLLPLRCSLPQNELPPICTSFVFFSFFRMKLLTSVTLLLTILLFFYSWLFSFSFATFFRFQISTLATKLGVRNIAFLGSGLLLINYVGAVLAAIYLPQVNAESLHIL